MPMGSRSEGVSVNTNRGQERPILFQKYFKTGGRTYAVQIKISQNSRKYLVLTEGVRDPATQQLKKHTICVFDQDLKEFFAMLQETVLYLRSTRDPGSSVAGMTATGATPSGTAARSATGESSKPQTKVAAPAGRPAIKPAGKPVINKTAGPVKSGKNSYRGPSARGGR